MKKSMITMFGVALAAVAFAQGPVCEGMKCGPMPQCPREGRGCGPQPVVLFVTEQTDDAAIEAYKQAVLAQIAKFDGVKLTASKLKVSDAEIKAAKAAVPKKTRDAVKHAIANIRKFSSMQIPKNWLSKPRADPPRSMSRTQTMMNCSQTATPPS